LTPYVRNKGALAARQGAEKREEKRADREMIGEKEKQRSCKGIIRSGKR